MENIEIKFMTDGLLGREKKKMRMERVILEEKNIYATLLRYYPVYEERERREIEMKMNRAHDTEQTTM